jgi:hypothetical protein
VPSWVPDLSCRGPGDYPSPREPETLNVLPQPQLFISSGDGLSTRALRISATLLGRCVSVLPPCADWAAFPPTRFRELHHACIRPAAEIRACDQDRLRRELLTLQLSGALDAVEVSWAVEQFEERFAYALRTEFVGSAAGDIDIDVDLGPEYSSPSSSLATSPSSSSWSASSPTQSSAPAASGPRKLDPVLLSGLIHQGWFVLDDGQTGSTNDVAPPRVGDYVCAFPGLGRQFLLRPQPDGRWRMVSKVILDDYPERLAGVSHETRYGQWQRDTFQGCASTLETVELEIV